MIENFKIFADFPRKGRIYHVYIGPTAVPAFKNNDDCYVLSKRLL